MKRRGLTLSTTDSVWPATMTRRHTAHHSNNSSNNNCSSGLCFRWRCVMWQRFPTEPYCHSSNHTPRWLPSRCWTQIHRNCRQPTLRLPTPTLCNINRTCIRNNSYNNSSCRRNSHWCRLTNRCTNSNTINSWTTICRGRRSLAFRTRIMSGLAGPMCRTRSSLSQCSSSSSSSNDSSSNRRHHSYFHNTRALPRRLPLREVTFQWHHISPASAAPPHGPLARLRPRRRRSCMATRVSPVQRRRRTCSAYNINRSRVASRSRSPGRQRWRILTWTLTSRLLCRHSHLPVRTRTVRRPTGHNWLRPPNTWPRLTARRPLPNK